MRALTVVADRKLELAELPPPPPPGAGEVQIRVKAVALNHIDVWGWRGMAFAKRKLPLTVGAEASGEIVAVGPGVTDRKAGDPIVMYGGLTCGVCKACREGRDNLCENIAGIMGFHVDGFARDLLNMPARLVIPVPAGIAWRDAACAPIAFATVQHMLFDNARLEAGEIAAVGDGVTGFKPGDRVVMYGALTCGTCKACREGSDNLCENVAGVMGFHVDGFARDLLNMPARLVAPVPAGLSFRDAACAPIAYGTVQHMLFDNAKLEPGETILVQAGGSGIGTVAIKMAKAIGCTVITTVGDDAKAAKAKALGADHVINYRTDRFEGVVRKLTGKKGVDVVFEHVGPDTFNGSLLCLKRGGRLVTCGSTSGQSTPINLFQLYLQQYRIFGSFGASMRNIRDSLDKMAAGLLPVIDTEVPLAEFDRGLARLESRQVFGKIIVLF